MKRTSPLPYVAGCVVAVIGGLPSALVILVALALELLAKVTKLGAILAKSSKRFSSTTSKFEPFIG